MSKLLRCDEQNRGKPRTSQEPNIAKFTLNLAGLVCKEMREQGMPTKFQPIMRRATG